MTVIDEPSLDAADREDARSRRPMPGSGIPRSRPIRSRLIQIVLILSAPCLIGMAALGFGLYHSARAQLAQNIFASANALASAVDRDLAGTEMAAQVLADSPSLSAGDTAAFFREATRTLPLLNGYDVVLVDGNGQQILNTLRPEGGPLTRHADLANQQKVFASGRPSVSNLFIGAITRRPALSVDVPVFRNREVIYTLGVAVDPTRLGALVQGLHLPAGWFATIVDSSDVIVAHSQNPALVGTLPPVRPSSLDLSDPHLIDTYRPDGTRVFVGFSKSAMSGWTVAISVPSRELYLRTNSILLCGGGGMVVILIIGLVLAVRESNRIAGAVRDLIDPAFALGRGEAPACVRSEVREIDELAQALDQAHQILQTRTKERDSAQLSIAERSLADEMFRLAVEACPNGMVMIGANDEIVMANGEIERQFGYSRDALIGQPAGLLLPERLSMADVLRSNAVAPEAAPLAADPDLFGRRRDGSEFPIEVGLNPIRTGEQSMVLAVIVDISERKRMERLKDEFVATVSHELRTPLTSIAGSLGLLVGQWSATMPASATRLVTIAHKNIQRLVRLINDILDIEKMESGRAIFNIVRVELNQIAAQALEDAGGLAAELGVTMRLEAAPSDAAVAADPDRLVQVITNLISNALKFSPKGAEIVLAVERRGAVNRVSVRDHGPGIPQQFRAHMFEKFAQADGTNSRSKGGTGLGLSIVKQIIDRLGGHVGFADADGGGTIFHVELPVWDGTAGGEIEPETGAMRPRLLLCEDEPAVAKVVRMRLRPAGFAVDFAHTPEIALTRALGRRYAAILVDLKLRDHDGIDLILKLRAQPEHHKTPIVVISGDPQRGRGDVRSARLNILEWFEKPIDFTRLTRRLLEATSPKPEERPRILHVDDDRHVLELVARRLDDVAEVISADSADHARRVIESQHVDLVVLDVGLGEASGLDLLQDLRDATGNLIPVIIFSSNAAGMPCDDQVSSALSKSHGSFDSLAATVRDRLALLPAHAA